MPLAIKEKAKRFNQFGSRLTQATRRVAKTVSERPLEVMLILFLIANLFVSMKTLFGLFILLYFADRWEIKNIFKREESVHIHQAPTNEELQLKN